LALTTEYFIETPKGRMSVRMPNFIRQEEHDARLRVIVLALNNAGILETAIQQCKKTE
jgi:hypothetical protein